MGDDVAPLASGAIFVASYRCSDPSVCLSCTARNTHADHPAETSKVPASAGWRSCSFQTKWWELEAAPVQGGAHRIYLLCSVRYRSNRNEHFGFCSPACKMLQVSACVTDWRTAQEQRSLWQRFPPHSASATKLATGGQTRPGGLGCTEFHSDTSKLFTTKTNANEKMSSHYG